MQSDLTVNMSDDIEIKYLTSLDCISLDSCSAKFIFSYLSFVVTQFATTELRLILWPYVWIDPEINSAFKTSNSRVWILTIQSVSFDKCEFYVKKWSFSLLILQCDSRQCDLSFNVWATAWFPEKQALYLYSTVTQHRQVIQPKSVIGSCYRVFFDFCETLEFLLCQKL